MTIAENAAAPVLALGLKWIADAAAQGSRDLLLLALAWQLGGLIGRHVANLAGFALRNILRESTSIAVQSRLAAVTASIPGIEHFERPDYLARDGLPARAARAGSGLGPPERRRRARARHPARA